MKIDFCMKSPGSADPLGKSDFFLYLSQGLVGKILCFLRVAFNDTV